MLTNASENEIFKHVQSQNYWGSDREIYRQMQFKIHMLSANLFQNMLPERATTYLLKINLQFKNKRQ